jgi:hypothetical protein
MPDANYGVSTAIGPGNDTDIAALTLYVSQTPTTSSVQVNSTFGVNGSASIFEDRPYCFVAIFR